jgi:iron complex outermembrane recepter protein
LPFPLSLLIAASMVPPEEEQWDTITVTAASTPGRVLPPNSVIEEQELLDRQPRSAADALRALPGVSVNPNSRGEAVAKLRGAEERQTPVFVDGAPLAVPWDGRADLGTLPAGLIGSVRLMKGAAPIEYGTNAVAGAVDLETRSGGERNFRAGLTGGSEGYLDGSLVATLPGRVDLTFAAAGLRRDAEPVASLAALPFSQATSSKRTNTDLRSGSLFGAARIEEGALAARAYLLHARARRGIAPESDRDPAVDAPRFWRYPLIRQTQFSLASTYALSPESSVKLVGWRQWYDQAIDQYTDASYQTVRTRERSDDRTLGGRLVLTAPFETLVLRLVATAQTSTHSQFERNIAANSVTPELSYRQNLYTIGGEADYRIGILRGTLGIAYDRSTNPRTGDKPAQPASDALAFSAAVRAPLTENLDLAVSAGRRTRFPSSRELFGEALGRFLPNPDLQPERAWLADVELRWTTPALSLTINPFVARLEDAISQRIVDVGGRRLRQHYNLSGSTRYGVEASADLALAPRLSLEASGLWLRARADAGDASFRRLPQRPDYELRIALDYEIAEDASLRAEYRRTGPAVDLDPRGGMAQLPAGNELSLRARAKIAPIGSRHRLHIVGAIDNLTDDVVLPQLGLPLPGRSFRVGLMFD